MSISLYFEAWKTWKERYSFENLNYPGVYAIAKSDANLSGTPFTFIRNIVYFGMTNSKGGVHSRLDQFDNSLQTPQRTPGHGGADRMKYKYPDYEAATSHLFVSVLPIVCDVTSHSPEDLRKMGYVTSLEYECFAQYCEKFGHLPEFNNRKQSPRKYSLTRRKKSEA